MKKNVIIALLIVFGLAGFAFTSAHKTESANLQRYVFTSNDPNNINNPDFYEELQTEPGCTGEGLPCVITLPPSTTLEDYVTTTPVQDIIDESEQKDLP